MLLLSGKRCYHDNDFMTALPKDFKNYFIISGRAYSQLITYLSIKTKAQLNMA
jgi:hypothetical protein